MTLNTMNMHNYDSVVDTIRSWPAAQRLTLVQDVLATLAPDITPPQRTPTLARALGLLATDAPAPSDENIALLLDQRRQERYGQ